MFSSSIAYMTIYASGQVSKIDKVKKQQNKTDFYLTSSQWRDHGSDAGMLVPTGKRATFFNILSDALKHGVFTFD